MRKVMTKMQVNTLINTLMSFPVTFCVLAFQFVGGLWHTKRSLGILFLSVPNLINQCWSENSSPKFLLNDMSIISMDSIINIMIVTLWIFWGIPKCCEFPSHINLVSYWCSGWLNNNITSSVWSKWRADEATTNTPQIEPQAVVTESLMAAAYYL